jgi:hypothetical protein
MMMPVHCFMEAFFTAADQVSRGAPGAADGTLK